MLHYGHIRLLERAKALGDYLIVGVTSDNFDMARGKINVKQPLMERVAAIRETGLADEVIIEEYQGQKIDDIKRLNVDIFTVGSDWAGHFDYLNEYCKVVYLERTEGVSSTLLRSRDRALRLGLVGNSLFLEKFFRECKYVNGIEVTGLYTQRAEVFSEGMQKIPCVTKNYDELLNNVDAVFIISHPTEHYDHIKSALLKNIHVLCEAPIAISLNQLEELRDIAQKNNLILTDGLKTAYSTAYYRMLLLIKSGVIGKVCSVDSTCTSLRDSTEFSWNSITEWGPVAMLPIFQILGTNYESKKIISYITDEKNMYDSFTKIEFIYSSATASIKVGKGVKSEGELIVSGTGGYVYIPAPWWKTDYFEVRHENPQNNKRFFYQLDGEGIRYEIVAFTKAIKSSKPDLYTMVKKDVSSAIVKIISDFYNDEDKIILRK